MAKNNLAKVGSLNIQNGNHVQASDERAITCFLSFSSRLVTEPTAIQ